MQEVFAATSTPGREVRAALATELACTERQVQVWLQARQPYPLPLPSLQVRQPHP
jgi:hypothetical protein